MHIFLQANTKLHPPVFARVAPGEVQLVLALSERHNPV